MALKIQDIEDLDKLIEEQDRLVDAIASDKRVLDKQNDEIKRTQDKLSWVLGVLKESNKAMDKLNTELSSVKEEYEEWFIKVNDLKSKCIELEGDVSTLSIKKSQLGTEIRGIEDRHVIELEELNKKNKLDIETYNVGIEIVKAEQAWLLQVNKTLDTNVTNSEKRLAELDRLIKDRQVMIDKLEVKYNQLSNVDLELKNKERELKVTEQKLNSIKLQIKLERENGKNSD